MWCLNSKIHPTFKFLLSQEKARTPINHTVLFNWYLMYFFALISHKNILLSSLIFQVWMMLKPITIDVCLTVFQKYLCLTYFRFISIAAWRDFVVPERYLASTSFLFPDVSKFCVALLWRYTKSSKSSLVWDSKSSLLPR